MQAKTIFHLVNLIYKFQTEVIFISVNFPT